ncbi:MAG: DUF1684 domain-containing protein [Lacisediminihabitans sp.]
MTALQVADWRRRVFALYAEVRAASAPAIGHQVWQAERDELFFDHPSTPLLPDDLAGFTGLPIAPYDPSWRFEAELLETEPARLDVETGTDGIVPFERLGRVSLPEIGTLDVWLLTSYGGGIFVPVKDARAGRAGGTYGGGRYLLDTIKGADLGPGAHPESLVLDFNFAYNPSCAYDPAWACPLAQAGNTLAVEIPVGERYAGIY